MTHINDLINRIGKNLKHQLKWARRHNLEAWRIYDRDIPQYPFAIDVYRDHIHLQEYDTGWQQTPAERKAWLLEILEAIEHITGFIIQENGRQFWVNLDKYLDTGLFLDHRNTRQKVGSIAAGKRFLNLFSYTGSFTVYAATGGAISSETVDLSNTYLEWAERNFALNNIDFTHHQIIRADVFQYLQQAAQQGKQFDLIVLDPPSFSNSKKMQDTLDIQRDQATLIHGAMALLAPSGTLYFSNNLRSFELNPALAERYAIKNISHQSIPEDFRNKKIHQCWEIRHK